MNKKADKQANSRPPTKKQIAYAQLLASCSGADLSIVPFTREDYKAFIKKYHNQYDYVEKQYQSIRLLESSSESDI